MGRETLTRATLSKNGLVTQEYRQEVPSCPAAYLTFSVPVTKGLEIGKLFHLLYASFLRALHVLCHFIHQMALWGRYYHSLFYPWESQGSEKRRHLPRVTQQTNYTTVFQIPELDSKVHKCNPLSACCPLPEQIAVNSRKASPCKAVCLRWQRGFSGSQGKDGESISQEKWVGFLSA